MCTFWWVFLKLQITINGKPTDSIHEHLIERDGLHIYIYIFISSKLLYDLLKTVKMHSHANILQLFLCPGPMSEAGHYDGILWALFKFVHGGTAWPRVLYLSPAYHHTRHHRPSLLFSGHHWYVPYNFGPSVWHRWQVLQKWVRITKYNYFPYLLLMRLLEGEKKTLSAT